jgi:MFS family permease
VSSKVTGVSMNELTKRQDFIFIVFILDRVGRRKPLIFGTIGITIALICEAAINSQNPNGTNRGLSIGGVFFLFCVSIIFSCSFGPISWVYMSEIMPMQIRARGNAFATGIGNWLVATFWAQISPLGLEAITWRFYFIFAGQY